MSVKFMSAVWEHSQHTGTRLLLMLALADHANDDGVCWPSIAHLAHKIRLSERQTKRLIQDLVGSGELAVEQSCGRGNANVYRILVGEKGDMGVTFSDVKGDTHDTFLSQKGDTGDTFSGPEKVTSTTPFQAEKVTSRAEKVTSRARKGDIAMSPQPSKNHQRTMVVVELKQEQEQVFRHLTALGVSESTAYDLVSNRDPTAIQGWCDYAGRAKGIRDPAAFVVHKLKIGDDPPGRRDDPDRYVGGKYAEFVAS